MMWNSNPQGPSQLSPTEILTGQTFRLVSPHFLAQNASSNKHHTPEWDNRILALHKLRQGIFTCAQADSSNRAAKRILRNPYFPQIGVIVIVQLDHSVLDKNRHGRGVGTHDSAQRFTPPILVTGYDENFIFSSLPSGTQSRYPRARCQTLVKRDSATKLTSMSSDPLLE